MVREIQRTNGRKVLVDDENYERLAKVKWSEEHGHAVRQVRIGGRAGKARKARRVWMHRLVLGVTDAYPIVEIDHVDGNGLNDQRASLRIVSKSQNQRNRRKQTSTASSRFKGFSWDKSNRTVIKPWRAHMRVEGKLIMLRRFADEQDAAKAYDEAATRYFGLHAHTNFKEGE